MAQELTTFDYLLNALEQASQSDKPAENGYGEKRKALLAHVRSLEARAYTHLEARNLALNEAADIADAAREDDCDARQIRDRIRALTSEGK
jgi:hypothetical protein